MKFCVLFLSLAILGTSWAMPAVKEETEAAIVVPDAVTPVDEEYDPCEDGKDLWNCPDVTMLRRKREGKEETEAATDVLDGRATVDEEYDPCEGGKDLWNCPDVTMLRRK